MGGGAKPKEKKTWQEALTYEVQRQKAQSPEERERLEASYEGRKAFTTPTWKDHDLYQGEDASTLQKEEAKRRAAELAKPKPKVETTPEPIRPVVQTSKETVAQHAAHKRAAYNKKQQLKIDKSKKNKVTSAQLAATTLRI